jgi:AraC family transcriptional regulator
MAAGGEEATLVRVPTRPGTPSKRPLHVRERTRGDHVQRVLRVLVHVQSRLDGDLSLARLARLAHLSPDHFQRVFAAIAGESCKHHVRRLRLERAARELRDEAHGMAAVAGRAGYVDVPTFYRAFRTHFAASPAAWRERAQRRSGPARMPASVRRWQIVSDPDGQLRSVPHPVAAAPATAAPAARLVQLPVLRIAFVRRLGRTTPRAVTVDFARLAGFAARRGPLHDPLFVRIHHDDPAITPPRRRRTDHAIVIGPRRRGDDGIGIATIGGTHALVATSEGPDAMLATRRWLEGAAAAAIGARRDAGPVLELLLDDPREIAPDAAGALRDVLVPVLPLHTRHPWYWRRRRPPAAPPTRSRSPSPADPRRP